MNSAIGNRQSALQRGSALIVALWVILLLSLLISSFAFDMHVEADITSYYRNRYKAQFIAQSGLELARVVLARMETADEEDVGIDQKDDALITAAVNLSRGVPVRNLTREIGEGTLSLEIEPEEGRRNVNDLSDEDWEEILDQANIPQERWAELIDSFADWVDTDSPDTSRLHGAGSQDPFYVNRGYKVKGAHGGDRVDTVDELLLIHGFDEEVLYGSPSGTPPEEAIRGIAYWLTAWSHGKVNINTASREVLLTLPGIDDWIVDEILELRMGLDGEAGTRDDGFESLEDAVARIPGLQQHRDRLTVHDVHFWRITAVGEVGGVRSAAWTVMRLGDDGKWNPVYWREEQL